MTLLLVQRTVINIAGEAKLADVPMIKVRLNVTRVEKVEIDMKYKKCLFTKSVV